MNSAIVYAADTSRLKNFLTDQNYLDCEISAAVIENFSGKKIPVPDFDAVKILRPNFPPTLDAISPQDVKNSVDAVFILSAKNFAETVNQLIKLGIAPRKIIRWHENEIEPLSFQLRDGSQLVCFEGLEFHVKNLRDKNFVDQTFFRLTNQKNLRRKSLDELPKLLQERYREVMGRNLNLAAPKTFTEKLNWLKLYDLSPLKVRLADKFAVRDWISQKLGEKYLIPLLGVWKDFDEINFDSLPAQFVLKCNHGSGMNVVVADKNSLDVRAARERFAAWLAENYSATQFELHYGAIDRKIIAEKFIGSANDELDDYKIHCFNGVPKFIQVLGKTNPATGTRYHEILDFDGQYLERPPFAKQNFFPTPPEGLKHLDEFKTCAEILCKNFAYVRTDFYFVDGQIFFGEMTFCHEAGFTPYDNFWTHEQDLKLGAQINLRSESFASGN